MFSRSRLTLIYHEVIDCSLQYEGKTDSASGITDVEKFMNS